MYKFWSKYHLPTGNSNLPKNRSEISYLLNKLNVLFEMPVYDTIAGNVALISVPCSLGESVGVITHQLTGQLSL